MFKSLIPALAAIPIIMLLLLLSIAPKVEKAVKIKHAVDKAQKLKQHIPQETKTDILVRVRKLMVFEGSFCGPCEQMKPVVNNLEAMRYRVERHNADKEPQFAKQHNVVHVPLFITMEQVNGGAWVELDRCDGIVSLEQLKARMDQSYPSQLMPVQGTTIQVVKPEKSVLVKQEPPKPKPIVKPVMSAKAVDPCTCNPGYSPSFRWSRR